MKQITRWWLIVVSAFCTLSLSAQDKDTTLVAVKGNVWNGHYYNEQYRINLHLDLNSASLVAPGFESFGTVNGYINGGIYGTWFLVRHEKTNSGLRLRWTNDLGSYVQIIDFQLNADGQFSYDAVGSNEMRRSEGRKLIKIAPHLIFVRK